MNTTMSTSLKTRMKRSIKWQLIALVAALPDWIQTILFIPVIRQFGQRVPILRVLYTGCYRTHPIDRALGTDTGGIYPPEAANGPGADAGNLPYMGCQPSIVRHALSELGDLRGHTFIDIGCGKGRPMIVATEFPFAAVLGYDLAEPLVEAANRNAAIVARRFPERVPMQAFVENALQLSFPKGDLVVFLFNPFGAALMSTLLDNLERAVLDGTVGKLTVVYIYPMCAHVFDQSTVLRRQRAFTLPYAADEIGYGAEAEQQIMVWSNTPQAVTRESEQAAQ